MPWHRCDDMDYSIIANSIFQVAIIFLIAPLAVGIMKKVKARFQSRVGAPIYQPYIDVWKLFMKDMVISSTTSWVFIAAPVLFFASIAIAAAVLPMIFPGHLIAADLILFIYIFAISRFMTAIAALDIGSSFGGLGASREVLYSILIEPMLFSAVIFVAAFTLTGSVNFSTVLNTMASNWPGILVSPAFWLAGTALFIVILAEMGRLPFDNPDTHLELTMVHEAMVLDYSGPLLGLIEWANSAKMVVFLGLFITIFLPFGLPIFSGNWLLSTIDFIAAVLVLSAFMAAIESITPKLRLFEVPDLMVFAFILSLVAFLIKLFAVVPQEGFSSLMPFAMLVSAIYFLFSATLRRRIQIYVVQSIVLALIFAYTAYSIGGIGSYWSLASTIIFKVILIPALLLKAYMGLRGEAKNTLDVDPIFLGAPLNVVRSLFISGFLICASFFLAAILGVHNVLLPVVFSIILIGGLIIATKTNVILQIMGFLIMENGIVLLASALSVQLPILSDIAALFDIVILVVIALMLAFKMKTVVGVIDSSKLASLSELTEEVQ